MAYIKAKTDEEQKYFDFLEALRQTGVVNIWNGGLYLSTEFGIPRELADHILIMWMNAHVVAVKRDWKLQLLRQQKKLARR